MDDPAEWELEPWDGSTVPELLKLRRWSENTLVTSASDISASKHIYGGQVLAQALVAASQTVTGASLHSLHTYFLRAGSAARPIIMDVERVRDGRSIKVRRVVARQDGSELAHLEFSFSSARLHGMNWLPPVKMPDIDPEALTEMTAPPGLDVSGRVRQPLIECRAIEADGYSVMVVGRSRAWVRVPSARGCIDPVLHQAMLAYISDHWIVGMPLAIHPAGPGWREWEHVSLDHAMWFHAPVRADEWHLFEIDHPIVAGSTALARGSIIDQTGRIVATVTQEAMIRRRHNFIA